MNEFYIRNVIEAALLAAGKPLQLAEIGQLFDESTRPKVEDLRTAIDALAAEYATRGIEVKETAAGFRIQVRREFSAEVSRLWPERPARYSRALLETLALIAYRQPITRAEIEAVRGVAVNPNIVKTVIERNWVRVVGHRDVPGRPELLGTTREFLDYFGLRSLDELPPLAELKAMGDYNLQLELPNGATPEGEPKLVGAPEGEGGAAVAGLLTSDQPANAENVSAEASDTNIANGAETASEVGALGRDDEVTQAVVADDVTDADVITHASADEIADADAVTHAAADEVTDADAVTHAAADEVTDANAVAHASADEVTDADAATRASADDETHSDAVAAATSPRSDDANDVDESHDVTASPPDADSEAEADRTLTAGEVANTAPDPDDSDSTATSTSSESSDALDDSSDDEADEDELSADGHGSRELVAAPRDLDD